MSTNILDHVRTLAVLLEAKFSNGGSRSRRAATAPTRATGGVFFFFPRSATIAENPKKETKPGYRVVSPTRAKSRTSTPLPKAFSIWASFFFKQTQVKLHDLFLHPVRAVRISKKIPSLKLTQLDAESIICLSGQIIDSRCRDKNRPHSATVSLTTVAECGRLRR